MDRSDWGVVDEYLADEVANDSDIGALRLQEQLRRSREWRRWPGPRMEVQEGSCQGH